MTVPEHSIIANATCARSVFEKLQDDDLSADADRAVVEEMVNGAPPFDQEALDKENNPDAANFNTREAATIINTECAAYHDLVRGRLLTTAEMSIKDPIQRVTKSSVISEELSRIIRKWPAFDFWYGVAIRQFVVHGMGAVVFPDPSDFRFKACGWREMKLPADTPATEEEIPLLTLERPTTVQDLLTALEADEDCNWDKETIKKIICKKAKTMLEDKNTTQPWNSWEFVSHKIKENRALWGTSSASINLIHFFVKEKSGKITHAILGDTGDENMTSHEWLFFSYERYDNLGEATIIFLYDVAATTYHEGRGRGYIIQPQAQATNALTCRLADGAVDVTNRLLQVKDPSQLEHERFAMAYWGNNEILPQGVDFIDRKFPDYNQTVIPVVQFLEEQLRRNNLGAKPTIPSLDKNAPAIAHQLEAQNNASISASALDRFYQQLDKLFWQMFIRIKDTIKADPTYPLVETFFTELSKRGVSKSDLDSVIGVKAYRVVGAGSAANRLLSYQRLTQFAGTFDPMGRRNLIYDIVCEEVGHENAARYLPPALPEEQRVPIDSKIAEFETLKFEMGKQSPVYPDQDHFVHIGTHLPPLVQAMGALQEMGEKADINMLMEQFTVLQAALPHISKHTEYLSSDTSRQSEVKEIQNLVQQLIAHSIRLRNQIVRLQEAAQAEAEAQQAREQEEMQAYIRELESKSQAGGPDSKVQAELMRAQVKAEIMAAEHRQKMQQLEEKFRLELAMKDAQTAAEILRTSRDKSGQAMPPPPPINPRTEGNPQV